MNLKSLTNDQLINETENAIKTERASTADVVRHFQEISDRRLFLECGFPSLYEMVTKHFGYCAGSAMRRINSMRLISDVPAVEAKIESGELSLTAAASVQSFFYSEAKQSRPYSQSAKIELIEACLKKSTREVELELCKRNPDLEKREDVRQLSEHSLRISFTISDETHTKLVRLMNLMSHSNPDMSFESLIDRLAEMGLDQVDPIRKAQRAEKRKAKTSTDSPPAPEVEVDGGIATETPTRYIDAETSRAVWVKNQDTGCEYVSPAGQRCSSHFQLQRDHIKPFGVGGRNMADNLRVYCGRHNRWRLHS